MILIYRIILNDGEMNPLTLRWDCEQTSQIWSGCASVELV